MIEPASAWLAELFDRFEFGYEEGKVCFTCGGKVLIGSNREKLQCYKCFGKQEAKRRARNKAAQRYV